MRGAFSPDDELEQVPNIEVREPEYGKGNGRYRNPEG